MPGKAQAQATSKAQRRLFAIAEHHPDHLYARNSALADLATSTLHEFAATPEKGLPARKRSSHPKRHPSKNLGKFLHRRNGR